MLQKLIRYEGEKNNNQVSFKVNDELLKYVQQAVLDLSYHNNGLYFRDLIYTHAIKGIPEEYPKEYPKEYPDNQGIPLNQVSKTERSGIPIEISVKQIDLPQLTSNSENELPNSQNELPNVQNELPQHTGKSVIESDKPAVDMSQVEIIEDYVPEGISATQYRMYVRRLEDENVKLTDALKVCHKALEGSQKQGDLSAMLYQSELGIHQIISWVWSNFQQFFPNQDLRHTLTTSVRNFYPSFPIFKLPNQ